MSARGRFITLEGIDGAGKSSHVAFLVDLVRRRGHACHETREPGGTPFGAKLREVVLHHHASPLAQALVMFADRSAHLEDDILPRLAAGDWVLCDRFTDSTFAYQCGGRGLSSEAVAALERMVHPDLKPDATFLFDIDPATALARQKAQGRQADKFEAQTLDFHIRVRNHYLELAAREPQRFHVIDSSASIGQVRDSLAAAFARAFP